MKKISFFVFLISSYLTIKAQVQIDMPQLDENNVDVDTVIHTGNYLLKVNVDTLFLINNIALHEYVNCLKEYKQLKKDYKENVFIIENIVDSLDKRFEAYKQQVNMLEEKFGQSLEENIKNNNRLMEENDKIKTELEKAKEDLSEAKHKIKNERWKSLGSKLLWGTGGLLVGVLAGGTLLAIIP